MNQKRKRDTHTKEIDMKQHTESLISYVMEWSGKSRDEAIEWLDRSLPRLKGDEDESADGD